MIQVILIFDQCSFPAAPKACGGQITATCTDANEHTANCPAWAAQGFCSPSSEHFDFMSANCAKSCKKCQSGKIEILHDFGKN